MVRIHFVDGSHIDTDKITYEEMIENLNKLSTARLMVFTDITINVNNITYIEKRGSVRGGLY